MIASEDREFAAILSAIVFGSSVVARNGKLPTMEEAQALARDTAACATQIIAAVDRHLPPKERKGGR